MEIKKYRISVDGFCKTVEAERLEYNKKTGQNLFYVSDELVHIAPVHALILKSSDDLFSKKIVDFIASNIESANEISKAQVDEYVAEGHNYDYFAIAIRNGSIQSRNQILEELMFFIEEYNLNN